MRKLFAKKSTEESQEDAMKRFLSVIINLKEDDTCIAWSPLLDETGEGSTEAEAQAELKEAVKLRLADKNLPIPANIKFAGMSYFGLRVEPEMLHAKESL